MGLFSKQKKSQGTGRSLLPPLPQLQEFSQDTMIEGKITADLDLPPLPSLDVPLPPTPEQSNDPDDVMGMELPSLQVPLPPHKRQDSQQVPAAPLPPLPKLASLPPIDSAMPSSMSERQAPMPKLVFPDLTFPEIPPAFRKPVFSKEDEAPLGLPDLDLPPLPSLDVPPPPSGTPAFRARTRVMEEPVTRDMYITMQDYCTTHEFLHHAKNSMKNAHTAVENCIAIKNRQDSAIDAYKTSIDQIQRKLTFVDKLLFELQA